MSSFGRDLQLTLQAAQREALVRRHAYLTVDPATWQITRASNAVPLDFVAVTP